MYDSIMEATKNFIYMNNNYIINTWDWLRIALACSIEALYDIIGYLDEANWKSTLSMDKYFESEYSYVRK